MPTLPHFAFGPYATVGCVLPQANGRPQSHRPSTRNRDRKAPSATARNLSTIPASARHSYVSLPPVSPLTTPPLAAANDSAAAQAAAARYRCEFVDLRDSSIDHDLFRTIPVELMFRYNFVPLAANNGTLEIALADPRNLNTIDELSLLLHRKLRVKVATASQIQDLLKKTEQSQRVLEEVTEGFALDFLAGEDNPD